MPAKRSATTRTGRGAPRTRGPVTLDEPPPRDRAQLLQRVDLAPEVAYRALTSRDRRFDGRFFVAVRTTGIYCRPICPAPTAQRRNVTFYPCAASAEAAGYRPCLRCRPETAPGSAAWLGTSASVARALRLIDEGALDRAGVEELAARLGVGERHLRRLFVAHLGTSPLAVAQTRRVQLAKKLIDETDLPMTHVALDAGFSSVRRFNAAVLATYGRSPTQLRRGRAHAGASASANGSRVLVRGSSPRPDDGAAPHKQSHLVLRLAYRPPLPWKEALAFLAARAIAGVEEVDGDRYRRRVRHEHGTGVVEVADDAGLCCLRVSLPASLSHAIGRVLASTRRLFDLGADPRAIVAVLGRDPLLAKRVARVPGLRVAGSWDPFETAVRAIVGQQVTVRAATTMLGRIAARFADASADATTRCFDGAGAPALVFPGAADIADADLAGLGMPAARAAALRALAQAVVRGDVALDGARPLAETVDALVRLPGIGPWTAAYIAMRALGEPDAFPAGDLGVRRALAGGDGRLPSIAAVRERAERWRPWRAYATVYLWTVGAGQRRKPRSKEVGRATAA